MSAALQIVAIDSKPAKLAMRLIASAMLTARWYRRANGIARKYDGNGIVAHVRRTQLAAFLDAAQAQTFARMQFSAQCFVMACVSANCARCALRM